VTFAKLAQARVNEPAARMTVPAAPAPGGIGPPVLPHLDGRPSASVRERLVVKARNHVQVRVLRGLIDLREAVPDERVTVRREAFVLCGLRLDEKFVRRCPLLSREVEGRRAMGDRDDDAASRKHVGRVAGIARRGVQAEGVLDAQSAARNRFRSQKTQSFSVISAFS
jgi:hypothetical protein